MHWEWVVPVIALALWILSSLIRNAEEPPRALRQRPIPGGGEPLRRPTSDVDKFLDEINRLRRQGAPQPRAEPDSASIPEVIPVEEPAVNFEKPKPPVMPRPEKVRPRPVRPRRIEAPRPAPTPQPAPRPEPAPVVQAAPSPAPEAPLLKERTIARASPAVTQLWALLKTPANVQAAILLREVLGPPRCRRRR